MSAKIPSSVYQRSTCTISHITASKNASKSRRREDSLKSAFKALQFVHNVDLLTPTEKWKPKLDSLLKQRSKPRYFTIQSTLGQFLEKEFFTQHVKSGNVSLLSEGKAPAVNTFSIHNGVLTMHLTREDYERTGLTGTPGKIGGSRELQPIWTVMYDLRSENMRHGKKGFDRLVWASNNALTQTRTWICSFTCQPESPKSLEKFNATLSNAEETSLHQRSASDVPTRIMPHILGTDSRQCATGSVTDLYEWLSLLRLQSPRTVFSDSIDPYLSRYKAPGEPNGHTDICCTRWNGLVDVAWLLSLSNDLAAECPPGTWFALSATEVSASGFAGGNEVTALRLPSPVEQYLVWDIGRGK